MIANWGGPFPYESRWHVVAESVKKLLPVLPVLRAAWDERFFKGRPGTSGGTDCEGNVDANKQEGDHVNILDPSAVTGALRSSTFLAQCHSIAALDLSRCDTKIINDTLDRGCP